MLNGRVKLYTLWFATVALNSLAIGGNVTLAVYWSGGGEWSVFLHLGLAGINVAVLGYLFARHPFGPAPRSRVHDIWPRDDLPCAWCEEVKHTTVSEVWSEADPTGRLVRLCRDCGDSCAGG